MTSSDPRGRGRGRLLVAALVAAGLALAGCGPAKAGAAVIIGGERIPISVIQDKVEAIAAARAAHGLDPIPADELAREQIQRIIGHEVVERTAAGRGVTVSRGEIDKTIADLRSQFGGEQQFAAQVAAQNIAPGDLTTFVQDYLTGQALSTSLAAGATSNEAVAEANRQLDALLSRTAGEMKVRVNPRYGVWSAATGRIDPPSNQLSTPENGSAETAPPLLGP